MRRQTYHNFSHRIHGAAKKIKFPLRVMFELTYRCNFKCRHCYLPDSYKKKVSSELKSNEVFSILDQLADIGCLYLGFTGGEPFVRKDIFDILWYARKKGFQVIIYTNGSLINEEKAEELKRINPNKIDITVPAWSRGAFESITGLSGSHSRVFQSIGSLHGKGIRLGFKTCVLKANATEIQNIRSFARSLGAHHRLDDMLFARLDGSPRPYAYKGPLSLNKDKSAFCGLGPQKTMRNMLFECGAGLSQAAITPFGQLKTCLMIDEPRFAILNNRAARTQGHKDTRQKDGLEEAWGKLKNFVASIKPDENYQCDKCRLYDHCKWCPARSWLYNKSFTSCEPVSRMKAIAMEKKG